MTKQKPMSQYHPEISVRHSKNNITQSIVLMKRVLNKLDYANKSLEGTDFLLMIQDIEMTKDNITDAIGRVKKYIE